MAKGEIMKLWTKQDWTVRRALRLSSLCYYQTNPEYNLTPKELWKYSYKRARGTWGLARQLYRTMPEP